MIKNQNKNQNQNQIQNQIQNQKELRAFVLTIIGEKEFIKYKKPNNIFTFTTIILNWLSIILLYFIFILIINNEISIFILPLLLILVASRQNALNVQVHEASHYSLFQNKKINDYISNLLCGYWIFYSTSEYRNTHNKHHLYLNTSNDPDYTLQFNNFSKKSIIIGFLYDALGLTALNRGKTLVKSFDIDFLGKIFFNLILILIMSIGTNVLNGFLLYLIFWAIPLFCIFPCIIRLRINAEHAKDQNLMEVKNDSFISRSSVGNLFERLLLGSQMEYHFEHHLFPMIPYINLIKIHKHLVDGKFFIKYPQYLNNGYISFWRNIVRS